MWTNSATVNVYHTPAVPALSVPATNNTGAFTASWSAVTWATSYTLRESVNGGAWTNVQQSAATSRATSGRGTATYGYQVQACNAGACSAWSGTASVVVTLPPSAAPPLFGGGTSTTGAYTISWSGVAGATSYTLYESVNGGGWVVVQAANVGSWSTSGRGNGTYTYVVQACNAGGCGPTSGGVVVTVTLIPLTPTGLTATPTQPYSKGRIQVNWGAVSGITRYDLYEVQRSEGQANTFNEGTATSAIFTKVGVTDTFYYQVRACNGSGCSPYSPQVSATVEAGQ